MEGSRWKAAGRRRGRAEIRGREGRAPWGGRSGQRPDETGRWGGPDGWDHALGGLTAGAVRAKRCPVWLGSRACDGCHPAARRGRGTGRAQPADTASSGRGSSLRIWRESE